MVTITWSGPDSSLPSPVNSVENGAITSNLTINVTDGLHEGLLYNCSASYVNCPMVSTSDSATFSIILPPVIVQAPMGGDFDINSSLSLTCAAMNYGTVSITWTGPQSNLQGMYTSVNNLAVTNEYASFLSNHSLGGVYTCMVTNEAGSAMASTVVYVRPFVLPESVFANNGDDILLMCVSQTPPNSSIQWEKENTLGIFEAFSESGQTLMFRPITFGDEGVYRCVESVNGQSDKISTSESLITSKHARSVQRL
jgi:hypothetical protein